MTSTRELWDSLDRHVWDQALKRYWKRVEDENRRPIEDKLNTLDPEWVRAMNPDEWYTFLREDYFLWKFTDCRYCSRNRDLLKRQVESGGVAGLHRIKTQLFSFDTNDILEGLTIATGISGLGCAGASGLLAVLFPAHFGTVDQFVVKALSQVPELPEVERIRRMKPESLTIRDGVVLIGVMRTKAQALNAAFGCDTWTPRMVDMALWACRDEKNKGRSATMTAENMFR